MSSESFFPERLSWIRKKRGLTKTSLAKLIGKDLRSISAFEAGEFSPQQDTIQELALHLRVSEDFFSLGPFDGPDASQASFRAVSKLSASKRDMALGSGAIAFAVADWFESMFELPDTNIPNLREEGPEQASVSLRSMWGLGEKPVSNMVHLLESKGVRVFSLALDVTDVDAFCTWHDETPYVFLNTKKSNARRRFDAAHELGHLVLHRHGEYDGRTTEKEADDFASAFLMPRDGFNATAPRLANLANIVPAKSKWGVSVAAFVVRLHRLNLISEWHYRTLFKQLSQRGYRSVEPNDHVQEKSQVIELVLNELKKEGVSVDTIAEHIGVSPDDIRDLFFDLVVLGLEGGSSSTPRRKGHLSIAVDNSKPPERPQ